MPTPLVMLHGANASGEALQPLSSLVRAYVPVETPNLLGHGGRPIPPGLTVRAMADDVLAYMDQRQLARAFLFGYSFGGYIALYLARHYPQRVAGVCLLAVKYVFDANTVQHLTYLTDPARLGRPGSVRLPDLTKTHAPQDWVAVTLNNQNLFRDLGTHPPLVDDDLRAIRAPVLNISSDQDQLVPLAEAQAVAALIPGGQLAIFPGQAHPLVKCPLPFITDTMGRWMKQVEAAWDAAWMGSELP